ncbi:hypothetical protein F5884DRAFT_751536 [Xylogone sp. PMI_703]|nr:hypothetical protein F5884DRAFT_751536 [Xylogone sp. PMI_703]
MNTVNGSSFASSVNQAKLKRSRTATIDFSKQNMDDFISSAERNYLPSRFREYPDKFQSQQQRPMTTQEAIPKIRTDQKEDGYSPDSRGSETRNKTKLPPRVSSLLATAGAQTSSLPAPVMQRGSTPRKYRPIAANILHASESDTSFHRQQKEDIRSLTVSSSSLNQSPPEYTPCLAPSERITETIHQSGTLSSVRNVGKGFRTRISLILSKRLRSERTKVQAPIDPKVRSTHSITKEQVISFRQHTHAIPHSIAPSNSVGMDMNPSKGFVDNSTSEIAANAPQRVPKKLHKVKHSPINENNSTQEVIQDHYIPTNLPDISAEGCLPISTSTMASLDRTHKKQDKKNGGELGVSALLDSALLDSALLDSALRDASEELGKVIELRREIASPAAQKALDVVILSIGNAIGAARASRIATLELEKATINLVQMTASATSMTSITVRDTLNGVQ